MENKDTRLALLKKQANSLPLSPGVYIMKNRAGEIIYIGKAKALKNRVTQYFGSGNQHTEKVRKMVSNVWGFETIVCDSEFEALILENSLIKQHQPKYNILLKDDKGYHYILITNDKWKRITTAMQLENKGEYIGPYYSAFVVKDTVEQVRRIFKLPDCNRNFDRPSKPCLNYHIGLCDAPCRAKTSLQEYNETVDAAIDFLRNKNSDELIATIRKNMEQAAEKLDFEYAAKLRDRINAIQKLGEKQKVVKTSYRRQDVFASAFLGESACISLLIFRNNQLTDKKHYIIEGVSDRASLYSEFLQQYYDSSSDIPPRILLDAPTDNNELLEKWLSQKSGKKVSIIVPVQAEPRALIQMCRNNAAENLASLLEQSGKQMNALNEIAELLGLDSPPRYIEAYDISNTAGSENVAGMVVFRDGKPYRAAYRHFKIKGFTGQDDYRSMAEVLDRRFHEYELQKDSAFSVLPDLILLDGGKGQVSAVTPVLKAHNIDTALFGMVKDSKHRTRAIATTGGDISIRSNRRAFTLITNIQDEVHRFAISYHRNRRSSHMLSSELKGIKGVGEKTAAALLRHFKSMKKLKSASLEELLSIKGVTKNAAQNIFDFYNKND